MVFLIHRAGAARGWEDSNDPIEEDVYPDQLLDSLPGLSLGAKLVPLAQVRAEYEKAKAEGAKTIQALRKERLSDWTSEDLLDTAEDESENSQPHPLVPKHAKPCPGDGLVVISTVTNGPASKCGIARGDVVFSFNGKKVVSIEDLQAELMEFENQPDSSIKVGIASYQTVRKGAGGTTVEGWKRGTDTIRPTLKRYALMAPLRRTSDKTSGDGTYTHRQRSPEYPPTIMSLSFKRKVGGKPSSLTLGVLCHRKEPMRIDDIAVRVDDQLFEFDVKSAEVRQKTHNGDILRHILEGLKVDILTIEQTLEDARLTQYVYFNADKPKHMQLIRALLTARKVQVRFSGQNPAQVQDVEVPVEDRAYIVELFNIYRELGGL